MALSPDMAFTDRLSKGTVTYPLHIQLSDFLPAALPLLPIQ